MSRFEKYLKEDTNPQELDNNKKEKIHIGINSIPPAIPEQRLEQHQQMPKEQKEIEIENFLDEKIQADTNFFSESKQITQDEYRNWQERIQNDFKNFSEEKQSLIMKILGNKLGELSKRIEELEQQLKNQNLPENKRQELKKKSEDIQNLKNVVLARMQAYHLALGPEKEK